VSGLEILSYYSVIRTSLSIFRWKEERYRDPGTTSLFNGERRSKQDEVFHALGTIDELNSCIGVAKEQCICDKNTDLQHIVLFLEEIQSRLLYFGTHLATPLTRSTARQIDRAKFPDDALNILEKKSMNWILNYLN